MGLTFSALKKKFLENLKNLNTLYGEKRYNTDSANSSIFMYANEFKDFIKTEFGTNNPISSMSVQDIMKMTSTGGNINLNASKNDNSSEENDEEDQNAEILDILNDLVQDENVKSIVDADGDNELTDIEKADFLNKIKSFDNDSESVSLEDVTVAIEAIKNGTFDELSQLITQNEQSSPDVTADSPQATSGNGSSGTSGSSGTYTNNDSTGGGDTVSGGDSTDSTEQNLDNLSEDELKKQLENAQTTLSDKQEAMKAVINGSDSELSTLENDIKTKEEAYQTKLNEVLPDLGKEYETAKTDLDTNTQTIAKTQGDIYTKQAEVDSLNSSISSLESQIQSCSDSIAKLEEQQKQENAPSDISSKISELNQKKATLEAQREQEVPKRDKAQEELNNLNNELTALEAKTPELTNALNAVQEKIDSVNNEELTNLKAEIDKLKSDYETKKADKKTQLQGEIDTAQADVDKIQTKLTEVQNNEINSKSEQSSLTNSYNLNGVEYSSLLSQDKLNQLVQNAANAGAANKYGHSGCCLGFSDQYCLSILGEENGSFSKLNLDNSTPGYKSYTDDNKNAVLTKVKEQLDSGKPAILQVSTAKGTRHYVAVVGYKSSSGSTFKESDLLIWDSYDGKLKGMAGTAGGTRHMITGYSTPYKNQNYGYQMFYKT